MVATNKAIMEWRKYQETQDAEIEIGECIESKEDVWSGWKKPKENWVKMTSDTALPQKN